MAALTAVAAPHVLHHYDLGDVPVDGPAVAAALGLDPARVLKTLVTVATGGSDGPVVAVVPVDRRLDLKALARSVGTKRLDMAEPAVAERLARSVVGAISPLGFRARVVVDDSVADHPTVYVSGGRRGLEIEVDPAVLVSVTGAATAPITVAVTR